MPVAKDTVMKYFHQIPDSDSQWKCVCGKVLSQKRRCLFIQQKMKIWSHTAEFKILAFSAVTANMLDFDLFEKVCIFVVWLGRFAPFAK